MTHKLLRENVSVISYFDLSEDWQAVARENHGDLAENQRYLEPDETHTPEHHVLWDLSEAMPMTGEYQASIAWSNACAIGLKTDDHFETVSIYSID